MPSPQAGAALHFERAVSLINDGDASGALVEFERARAFMPSSVVVAYNLGLLNASLNRPLSATRDLEQALAQPAALKPAEVERARTLLRQQRDKIGQVTLSTNVKRGVVVLDNVEFATLPLAGPLQVPSGVHVMGIISPGHAPLYREILVSGRESSSISLELTAIDGLLAHVRISSAVPAADVFVDAERVGETPLPATLTLIPGRHRFELRRRGYLPDARELTLQEGAEASLSLELRVDPHALALEGGRLEVVASEAQVLATIDGSRHGLLRGPILLPRGPHRLLLERNGFLPVERDVDVPSRMTRTINVHLLPTAETRAKYLAGAEQTRFWSYAALGVGALVAVGGATVAVIENSKLPEARRQFAAVEADRTPHSGRTCDATLELSPAVKSSCASDLDEAVSRVNGLSLGRTLGLTAAGVGGALLVTGLVLRVVGDDPHRYDEGADHGLLSSLRIVPSLAPNSLSVAASGTY
ncbi:MAG TPA: PEGA domain-containing protein [Polyangiaceae bacterium]|nr:PEGA domain-containing protein [Polyangiaceae bacterium]